MQIVTHIRFCFQRKIRLQNVACGPWGQRERKIREHSSRSQVAQIPPQTIIALMAPFRETPTEKQMAGRAEKQRKEKVIKK